MDSLVEHDPHPTGGRLVGAGWTPPHRALVRAEARLVMRHPVTIGSLLLGGVFALMFHLELTTDTSVWYQVLTGMPLVVLGSGMTVVGVLVGSRSRHDRTEDLYDSSPTPEADRAAAQIGAIAWTAVLAAALVAAGWTATRAWEGLPVALDPDPGPYWIDYPLGHTFPATPVAPSLVELAQGPATVFLCGLVGLALGRWVRTRWTVVAMLPLVLAYWITVSWGGFGDARWFLPFVDAGQHVGSVTVADDGSGIPVVQGFDVDALGWHLVYLGGVATVLVALLTRSVRHDRRARLACALGLGAVACGGILQVETAVGNLP
jgi:hypothetical protein